jgi:hypothetical protein
MKETNIDCMKYRKSTHLAGIDVETIIAEKGNCILTIKEAYYDTNVDVSGNKTAGYFIEFIENVKPMVVNSINRKVIGNIVKSINKCSSTDSRNIGNWSNIQIELLFDANVKMMGKVTGGIRIAEKYELPTLLYPSENFDKCKLAIEKSGFTIEQIKSKYKVSNEIEKLLIDKK